jgi:hypothetical protein
LWDSGNHFRQIVLVVLRGVLSLLIILIILSRMRRILWLRTTKKDRLAGIAFAAAVTYALSNFEDLKEIYNFQHACASTCAMKPRQNR